jgi:hypothetical protein
MRNPGRRGGDGRVDPMRTRLLILGLTVAALLLAALGLGISLVDRLRPART